ncbi:MAG TPA: transcriptional regulator [Nitrospiria bacterium]|nr:transcriptional regulator [Nitrospiria bacterium]
MGRTTGKPKGEIVPQGATATPRQRIIDELERGAMTARDLSQALGLPEKEVAGHLEHVAKSLKPPRRLVMTPASCHHCGFAFPGRHRLSTPGRCPRCRHEGISPPLFRIEGGG